MAYDNFYLFLYRHVGNKIFFIPPNETDN